MSVQDLVVSIVRGYDSDVVAGSSRTSRLLKALLRLGFTGVLTVALGLLGGAFWVLPGEGRPAHGVFIGARIPPSEPSLGTWLESIRQQLLERPVTLVDGLEAYPMTLGSLGVELDVEATMQAALLIGREAALVERFESSMMARHGFVDVPLRYSVDMRRAEVGLEPLHRQVRREPVNAYVSLRQHARVADVPGARLDVLSTMARVMQGVVLGHDVFPIQTLPIAAGVTLDDLGVVDVTKVVASFDTTFSVVGQGRGRSHNIELAARAIDGMVLKPGQSFSFNTVVGRRTVERGYRLAPVIVGDEMELGVGGGICQVASTLYAAALYSAMQITERWAHGRPSSYTRLGLDATVVYPSKDLRFVNSLPYPIILHVFVPERGRLRAEVLGGEPVAKVSYRYGVARTSPFVRRIVSNPALGPGTAVRKQKGIQGYSVVSMVELDFGARVDTRSYHSEYRPTPEIFWVSLGYDVDALPELPKGAKGLEEKMSGTEGVVDPAG